MSAGTAYLLAGLSFAFAMFVRSWLQNTYRTWSRVPNEYNVTGAHTAAAILKANGADHVQIQAVRGRLTDHYDPVKDILRLSESNFGTTSVAAMAVSAHEAGHALQDHSKDARLTLRRFLVPIAALGSRLGPIVVVAGFMLGSTFVLNIGALLLAGMVVFQLATLPVEFNASKRALEALERLGLSDPEQRAGVEKVLRAAAFTYVAAAATTLAYLGTLVARGRGRFVI